VICVHVFNIINDHVIKGMNIIYISLYIKDLAMIYHKNSEILFSLKVEILNSNF